MEPILNELLRVKNGMEEHQDAKWLETGDIVRVKGIYPHIILVEKVKGSNGWHMRQCYPRRGWRMFLERMGSKK